MKITSRSIVEIRLWPLFSLALAFPGHAADLPVTGNLTVTGSAVLGTSSTSGSFTVRPGGVLVANGTFGTSPLLLTVEQGVGTRLLWHPRKAAFRAGYVESTEWNEAAVGEYSVAFGNVNIASGYASSATGFYSTASGWSSTAAGFANTASGWASTAFGSMNTVDGGCAISLGTECFASGGGSTVMGCATIASGGLSTAMGDTTAALGDCSTSMGVGTTATGFASTAMGSQTAAASYASTAIGSLNLGGGSPDEWIAGDPLFEIGNGTTTPSNAVTVYKNGNMDVQGVVTCAPGGDIPMFTGN